MHEGESALDKEEKVKSIVCFGCGKDAEAFLLMVKDSVKIEFFCDNGAKLDGGKFRGYDVFAPTAEILKGKTIVVTTSGFYAEIKQQLVKFNLSEKKDFMSVTDFFLACKDDCRKLSGLYLRDYKALEYTMLSLKKFPKKEQLEYKIYKKSVVLPLKRATSNSLGRGGR